MVHQRQSPITPVRVEQRLVRGACRRSRDCSARIRSVARCPRDQVGGPRLGACSRPGRSRTFGVAGRPSSMRVVIQRVGGARVEVDGATVGRIGAGVALLVGVTHGDTRAHAAWVARRVAELRIFADADGKMNRSLRDIGGGALVVSQFTLYADTSQGRRPSYVAAASPAVAAPLIEAVVDELRTRGLTVATGRFGAHMDLLIEGDGPVTIILDTADVPSLAQS